MRGQREGWYLLAYDIADQRRLQRVHRLIKKNGVAAQKSVFFIFGTETRIQKVLDDLTMLMKLTEDDLRAWPISNPKKVWSFGTNPLALFPLIRYQEDKIVSKASSKVRKKSKWRRLLGL